MDFAKTLVLKEVKNLQKLEKRQRKSVEKPKILSKKSLLESGVQKCAEAIENHNQKKGKEKEKREIHSETSGTESRLILYTHF
ncbi:hypothetical protein WN51_13815 [Melipona quadrifasciata]|uniref:Uncharacterized protein n=1 Tax=Melipona quadrifasciata TaxID=166423 RepID=A0A0M8ZYX0_9HYME|nr:hypothetical protein WN51_13815 [Melipona quadrifasciata]